VDLIYLVISSMKSKLKLLDKCEALTLLCTRASSRWSFIKFCFNIPLVFTSSAMCIINSISTDANEVKIPNIIVNAISVLIMSLANNTRASEKFENFKKLSQQFMLLSQEIDALEEDNIPIEEYKLLLLKYENLVQGIDFEEIPISYKNNVSQAYQNANRHIPIQLNGTIGNVVKKRPISDEIGFSRGIEFNEMV
tara:strand:+ start:6469 stop:7053 length:585 start_codon:yes stop_codon:yes gene_type:complete